MWVVKCGIWLVLVVIAWQDFKFRAVYWWLFLILPVLLGTLKVSETSIVSFRHDLLFNVCFLLVQFSLLTFYFWLRNGRFVNLLKGYFGLGDLLFLASLCFYLSFEMYIFFYLLSLVIVIIIAVFSQIISSSKQQQIPLAGEQAVLLLLLFGVQEWSGNWSLTTEGWLIGILGF